MSCLRKANRYHRIARGIPVPRIDLVRCAALLIAVAALSPQSDIRAASLPSDGAAADLSLGRLKSPSTKDLDLSTEGNRLATALAHYSTALQFESAGKMRQALEHYEALFRADPTNSDLAAHTAELAFIYLGREEALRILNGSVTANPNSAAPLLHLATFQATHVSADPFGGEETGDKAITTALKKFPADAQVYRQAVTHYLSRRQRDLAIKAMEQAGSQTSVDPHFWLATGRAAQEVWPLAQSELIDEHQPRVNPFFEKALAYAAKDPDREAVTLQVAQYYLLTNQLPRTRKVCEDLAKATNSLSARKILYRLYKADKEDEQALGTLEGIVKDAPSDIEQRRLLAAEYEQRKLFEKAIPHWESLIQLGGAESTEYEHVAELLLQTREFDRAIHLADRATKVFPDVPGFYALIAVAWRLKGDLHRAAEAYASADELTKSTAPGNVFNQRFYFGYGVVLEKLGRFEDASRELEKSISITPRGEEEEAANTMNYLGYMWLELGQHLDKAGELITKANALEPNNPAFMDSLGWYYFKKGDYEAALKELTRAEGLLKELQPEDAEIVLHIGRTLEKLNQPDKARQYFEKADALNCPDEKVRAMVDEALGRKKPDAPKGKPIQMKEKEEVPAPTKEK